MNVCTAAYCVQPNGLYTQYMAQPWLFLLIMEKLQLHVP